MKEVFPIIPPDQGIYWVLVPLILLVAALLFFHVDDGLFGREESGGGNGPGNEPEGALLRSFHSR